MPIFGENDRQNQSKNSKILITNNDGDTCESYVNFKKHRKFFVSCFCFLKENLKQAEYVRTRSKSESYGHFATSRSDAQVHHTRNRIRTYSGNRTMHDKGVNVCIMPENMQELLLDGYRAKEDINWQPDINGKTSPASEINAHDFDPLGSVQTSKNNVASFHYQNGKTVNERLDGDNQRECIVGVKRSREESPSLGNNHENNNSGDGIPLKIQPKNLTGNSASDNVVFLKRTEEYSLLVNSGKSYKFVSENDSMCSDRFNSSQRNGYCELPGSCVSESRIDDDAEPSVQPKLEIHRLNGYSVDANNCNVIENVPMERELYYEINGDSGNFNQDCSEENEEECECSKDIRRDTLMIEPVRRDENSLHSGLRPSLFPNVPPYIKFSTYDTKGEPFPLHIHRLLRWKLCKITPRVVRKVVCNSGYRLLRKSTYWGGTWGKHTRSVGFKTLFDYQKMNHFPGTFQIGRKDRLWKSLQKLMSKFGKQKFDLMPTTYVLPQDKKLLRTVWKKNGNKDPWIIKPPASARGTGIKVVHKWCQIPEIAPVIVQKYISNPFLINETKFDLRLYVLVTSVNPLRIYLYDNGLVRFASVKYSTELNTLGDRYMHLTNYSINKLSSKYKQNEDAHACQGHKWTLQTLWNYMEKELSIDVKTLWQRLIDLIIKTIISGENSITQLSNANLGSRYNSYELFGIDVLFDTFLKPWLLEVNISPSLHSASPLDLAVKAPLVHDLMNIVGFQIPSSKKFTEEQLCIDVGYPSDKCFCYDNRLYTRSLTISEKCKHQTFTEKSRREYLKPILEDLTPDDIRHLIQYEDELTQLGSFQKIFPTPTSYEYLQYFESPRYYNLLFDSWETKYHTNREEGIQLLYTKCEAGIHLCVPKANANPSKICETRQKCVHLENDAPVEPPKCGRKPRYTGVTQNKKTAFAVKPRYRLRHSSLLQHKTYLLRSRKRK